MERTIQAGCRVKVQFGKSKTYTALVLRLHDDPPKGTYKMKDMTELVDSIPVVSTEQFNFWSWIAQYYMCSLGDVYKAAIPLRPAKGAGRALLAGSSEQGELCSQGAGSSTLNPLNSFQSKALEEIETSFADHDVTLLHGVTSCGKTEVYMHLINKYISEGRQVLYLLPEIALTTQITERLRRVFGDDMGVYHSKFTEVQREKVYLRQMSDNPYKLILGVRSSIFLPFQDLGLVIIDEEHETSYKQQDPAPRYHARSAAIMLAKQLGAKTLLGTATPSMESYTLAKKGKYGLVEITQRYQDIQMPQIEVVDIRRLRQQKRMKGAFSQELIDAIGEALDRKEQVILFQNRRGFSNFIQCKNCGWVPHCQRCDVSLTYHKTAGLSCHYCGNSYTLPAACPQCGEHDFMFVGLGTEKIETQIHKLFPEARVARMDLDTAKTRKQYEEIIDGFSSQQYDILIGTQMVSKGLDFDKVSVVGVLDADTLLNMPDFRSYERAFHVLSQVAGRAGRKHHQGRVILQTRSANLPVVANVVDNNYGALYMNQSAERRLFRYPPFSRLIYVYLKHRYADRVERCAQHLVEGLRKYFGDRALGPDRPVIGRVNALSIRKIVVKLQLNESPAKVKELLRKVQAEVLATDEANGLIVYYDVDPA